MQNLKNWSGSIEEFADKVHELLSSGGGADGERPTVRLIRDYIQRGLLGLIDKQGKELAFTYEHLLRFVAARVLLADGWNLGKIAEHINQCRLGELEAFLPQGDNRALRALHRIQQEGVSAYVAPASRGHLQAAARMSSVQLELNEALGRLGLPAEGPVTENVTLIAIAPWFQALVTTDRIHRITLDEAEQVGRAVTASLLKLVRRKEFRK